MTTRIAAAFLVLVLGVNSALGAENGSLSYSLIHVETMRSRPYQDISFSPTGAHLLVMHRDPKDNSVVFSVEEGGAVLQSEIHFPYARWTDDGKTAPAPRRPSRTEPNVEFSGEVEPPGYSKPEPTHFNGRWSPRFEDAQGQRLVAGRRYGDPNIEGLFLVDNGSRKEIPMPGEPGNNHFASKFTYDPLTQRVLAQSAPGDWVLYDAKSDKSVVLPLFEAPKGKTTREYFLIPGQEDALLVRRRTYTQDMGAVIAAFLHVCDASGDWYFEIPTGLTGTEGAQAKDIPQVAVSKNHLAAVQALQSGGYRLLIYQMLAVEGR